MDHHDHGTVENIRIAFFLNLGFTILEIVGGLLTNSVAILSDSLHDLGDTLSLGAAWYLERYAQKDPNARYSYGYRRFSLLGSLITAAVLVIGSLFILSETVPRLLDPQAANAPGMVILALIGVAVNGFAALRLRGSASLNAQTVAWHLLEDVLGWVVVLVVGVVLVFVDLPILDPILSIVLMLYVLYHVIGNLRQTLSIFLQAAPESIDVSALTEQIMNVKGVRSQHHTHVWSLDGEHHVLTTHVVVDTETDRDSIRRIKEAVRQLVADAEFEHVTIEVEYEGEERGMLHT